MTEYDQVSLPAGRAPDVVPLFLALFLLVLAFFIILVSISSFEDVKSRQVMDSLTSAFTSVLPPVTDPTEFSTKDGDVLAGERFQEQVTGLFSTAIQVSKVTIVQPGRTMRIAVPADTLFFEDEARFRPALTPLLDRVVATLSARPAGLRYEMEFVIGSEANGEDGEEPALPVAQTLETLRGGAFAREMSRRGVPPDSVAIGIMPGDPSQITIWFFVRRIGGEAAPAAPTAPDTPATPAAADNPT